MVMSPLLSCVQEETETDFYSVWLKGGGGKERFWLTHIVQKVRTNIKFGRFLHKIRFLASVEKWEDLPTHALFSACPPIHQSQFLIPFTPAVFSSSPESFHSHNAHSCLGQSDSFPSPDWLLQALEFGTPKVEETQLLEEGTTPPQPYQLFLSNGNSPPRAPAAKMAGFCPTLGWAVKVDTWSQGWPFTGWQWHIIGFGLETCTEPIRFSLLAFKTTKKSVNRQVCNGFDARESLEKSGRTRSKLKVWGN